MAAVRREGRVIEIEHVPELAVHRSWDLGVGDDTSIWFFQTVGAQIFILDHYVSSGVGLEHYRDVIATKRDKYGWRDGDDYVPHDAKVKEWGSGRTRVETMSLMGLHPVLVPHASLDDGINAVRRTLPLCVFHPRTEVGGIEALEQYRREWDEERKSFKANAVHDWTSHPSDSFRYLSLAWRKPPPRRVKTPPPMPVGIVLPPPLDYQRGGMVL
jgi:hypothetical protein